MAETRLIKGAASLNAANWEDATGFADNGQLAIVDSYAIHENLDRSGDTITGIDYLHIRGGMPQFGPANGRLKAEFDSTYTSKPNFIWRARGGVLYLDTGTSTCTRADLIGGGACFLTGGVFTNAVVAGTNSIKVQAGCDFGAALAVLQGQGYLEIDAAGGYTLPDLRMTHGQPHAYIKRVVESAIVRAGLLRLDNRTGTAGTTLNLYGGVYRPIAGTFNTVNWYDGEIDLNHAEEALTLGGTAFNVFHNRKIPDSTELVTMGTPTKYPSGFSGGMAA
jgi:hypothetical protein